ncbi:hypothetical protein A2U01_0039946, partial [Trifolium medium]|nr:hypothetical protein [Trifolium medium]
VHLAPKVGKCPGSSMDGARTLLFKFPRKPPPPPRAPRPCPLPRPPEL